MTQRCQRESNRLLTSSLQPPASGRVATRRAAAFVAGLALMCCGANVAAQDDFKLIKVEQDVRNLERQVYELNREVDDLKRRLAQSRTASSKSGSAAAAASSTQWVDASIWDRVRNGMDELQVIDLLGPPTSMRGEGDTRTLLYALEIGASGFLSGSVSFKDKKVTQVERPVLK